MSANKVLCVADPIDYAGAVLQNSTSGMAFVLTVFLIVGFMLVIVFRKKK